MVRSERALCVGENGGKRPFDPNIILYKNTEKYCRWIDGSTFLII